MLLILLNVLIYLAHAMRVFGSNFDCNSNGVSNANLQQRKDQRRDEGKN